MEANRKLTKYKTNLEEDKQTILGEKGDMNYISIGMFWWATDLLHWPRPKGRRQSALQSSCSITAALRTTIVKAWMVITTATILALVLGSIATMPLMVSAQHSTNSVHSHGQSNYHRVDAVSANTGLSNGYATPSFMQNYYELRARDDGAGQQQQQHYVQYHPQQQSLQFDKDYINTGRALLHATGRYGSRVGGSGAGAGAGATTNALEVYSVPESGFMPTTLTAAGQHYATSFTPPTDKNNAFATSPATAEIDLQQRSAAATSYSNMVTAFNDNTSTGSAHRLHGRLSNYEDDVGGVSGGRNSNSAGDIEGIDNYALAYDNYAANLYNEADTNGQEHQQHFANYFTPTTAPATAGSSTYDATTNQEHKYLPLNNYHYEESENKHQELGQKPHIFSRSSSVPSSQSANPSSSSSASSSPYYNGFSHASNIVPANYQTWNLADQRLQNNYYFPKDMPDQHTLKEDDHNDINEPEAAESSYVVHLNGKKGTTKSKRSEPLHATYENYSPTHLGGNVHGHHPTHDIHDHDHAYSHDLHSSVDNAETVEYQRQQLDDLQKQLQQQQHQFVTLQHQLIDHDQQLQIQKHQAHYQVAPHPTLPPVTTTVHHTPHSLQAIAGTPLSKHTHVVRTIPIAQRQQVYVPQKQNVNVEVPDPIITTVNKPVPIQIPVSKTIAIPDIKEVKIPIEKVKPYPVERAIPYIVEKRVPYTVEKQVAKPYYYSVPIKVPIVHTVIHKVRTVQPQHYQNNNHIPSYPVHYKGHVRHVTHHHGLGHSHFGGGGGHYSK